MHNNNSYARWLAYQECEAETSLKKETNDLLSQSKESFQDLNLICYYILGKLFASTKKKEIPIL